MYIEETIWVFLWCQYQQYVNTSAHLSKSYAHIGIYFMQMLSSCTEVILNEAFTLPS